MEAAVLMLRHPVTGRGNIVKCKKGNMVQFNDDDKKATSDFMKLLVNLGKSPTEAYKCVNEILKPLGWAFVYFNDVEDFWICDNDMP